VCFCESPDLLSQWRGYTPGAAGYSIGFKALALAEPIHPGLRLRKAIYVPSEQTKLVDSMLDAAERCSKKLSGTESLDPSMGSPLSVLVDSLEDCCLWFKHPMFVEENEWRLIASSSPPMRSLPLSFRARHGVLVPYVVLKPYPGAGHSADKLWILSVRHGPTLNPDMVKKGLGLLLDAHGQQWVEIEGSEIPLRSS